MARCAPFRSHHDALATPIFFARAYFRLIGGGGVWLSIINGMCLVAVAFAAWNGDEEIFVEMYRLGALVGPWARYSLHARQTFAERCVALITSLFKAV